MLRLFRFTLLTLPLVSPVIAVGCGGEAASASAAIAEGDESRLLTWQDSYSTIDVKIGEKFAFRVPESRAKDSELIPFGEDLEEGDVSAKWITGDDGFRYQEFSWNTESLPATGMYTVGVASKEPQGEQSDLFQVKLRATREGEVSAVYVGGDIRTFNLKVAVGQTAVFSAPWEYRVVSTDRSLGYPTHAIIPRTNGDNHNYSWVSDSFLDLVGSHTVVLEPVSLQDDSTQRITLVIDISEPVESP